MVKNQGTHTVAKDQAEKQVSFFALSEYLSLIFQTV